MSANVSVRTVDEAVPAALTPSQVVVTGRRTPPPPKRWHERWWPFTLLHNHRRQSTQDRHASEQSLASPVCPCEVRALLHFVTARGLDPDSKVSAKLNDDLNAYERALEAKDQAAADKLQTAVMRGYAALTRITYREPCEINGWTILSTEHVVGHIWVTIFWGILFFILAATTQILSNWYASAEPGSVNDDWLFRFHQFVLVYLFPFFWGGVGACIYLAKTLGDKAAQSTFDSRKLRGQGTRIFIGAIMGAVVVHLFYENVTELATGFASLGPAGVAFLTGMGVKVIYGALEKIIESLDAVIRSIGTPQIDRKTNGAPV